MVWTGDSDRALILNSDGELILSRLNPAGYHEQSRTKIIGATWAHPVYMGDRVYARSDDELVCVALGALPSQRGGPNVAILPGRALADENDRLLAGRLGAMTWPWCDRFWAPHPSGTAGIRERGGIIMTDTPESDTPSLSEVQDRLHEIARGLRHSGAVDPESRQTLGELVDELTAALASANVPPAEVARLAESTAHLAESLHHQRDRGLLASARDRFERALVDAETHAPVAAGLARQLLEALANVGI